MAEPSLETFRREVERPESEIDFARAALAIATCRYPDLDLARYLRRLDEIADPLKEAAAAECEPRKIIAAINQRLYADLGFRGNLSDYGDPRNSYLNDVLDGRTGIPITMSTVYFEVARRLGFPLQLVSFPAHFLLRHPGPPEELVIDAFSGGRLLAAADLQALLDGFYGGQVQLSPAMLRPATKSQTLYRMLNNLKVAHIKAREPSLALPVINMMLVLLPENPVDVRDRGFALHALNRHEEAAAELGRYLALAPGAPDAQQVRAVLDAVERMAELLR